MKKFIVIAFMALAVTMIAGRSIPALADEPEPSASPTPTPDPITRLALVQGGSTDINTMIYYYHNVLTSEQQKIARFLIGSYNYMYLNARGFSYENVEDLDDLIQRFDEFAAAFIGVDSNYIELNSSRWSTNFQIYIASIITYAGNIDVTFDVWKNTLRRNLVIPYTSEALDAWTDYYNDPSNNGITSFGDVTRDWVSGVYYPYLFGDYNFESSWTENHYRDFILNRSPVLYTNTVTKSGSMLQLVCSFKDIPVIDTLYIERANPNEFHRYRYGDYSGNFYGNSIASLSLLLYNMNEVGTIDVSGVTLENRIKTVSNRGMNDLIDYAIKQCILRYDYNIIAGGINWSISDFVGWYPLISHVVLVDSLDNLSNRQDVYNDYSLGIIGGSEWIRKPNPNKQIVWYIDTQEPKVIEPDPEDPSIENLITPGGDDISNQIINHTVINNYEIIAPGSQINVPVNWLESEGNYLDYTNTTALPFFIMVGDIFNALGEIRVFIIGVLILGLAGGVLVKFLL